MLLGQMLLRGLGLRAGIGRIVVVAAAFVDRRLDTVSAFLGHDRFSWVRAIASKIVPC